MAHASDATGAPLQAGSTTQPVMLLTRRRTASVEIYRMLASHVAQPDAGIEPFSPGQPFELVSAAFREGRLWDLGRLVRQALRPRPFFRYQYDVLPADLGQVVFEALAQAGYRAIRLEREDEAERLFSLAVCSHFNLWSASAIVELRDRVRAGERVSAPSTRVARQLVRTELARKQWFDRAFGGCGIPAASFTYEALFRRGTAVFGEADRLFAAAGLPNREACVGDASLLRFAFHRGHYTLALAQYSRPYLAVYEAIKEELALHESPEKQES
jgi:hypothetical protein